jgi:hypothetical protein
MRCAGTARCFWSATLCRRRLRLSRRCVPLAILKGPLRYARTLG